MTSHHSNDVTGLKGFDPDGEVFLRVGRVYRGVFRGKGVRAKSIFDRCKGSGLFERGVVRTTVADSSQFDGMSYDVVFEHERIPFISYAYEWPPSMMKDAATFQLDLNITLLEAGLLLKDCGVTTNVLFNGPQPVFVDFLSIIDATTLTDEEWLTPRPGPDQPDIGLSRSSAFFHAIFTRMFYPSILFPLYLYHQNRDLVARTRLRETALNTTHDTIAEREVHPVHDDAIDARFAAYKAEKERALKADDWKGFLWIQRQEIEGLRVARTRSRYSDYYDLKGESFEFVPSSDWNAKQWGVYSALDAFKPGTVLDVGANTGWFSVLAATHGAAVVSLDEDVACMDLLYQKVKERHLRVLPLVIDFLNPTPDIPSSEGLRNDPHVLRSQLTSDTPLFLSAEKRLACEMVMALALIHHLCLGAGRPIEDVIAQLARYSHAHLVLEFVAIADPLIVNNPAFFTAHHENPHAFEWYSLERCMAVLRTYFGTMTTLEVTPTRFLLVCTDKVTPDASELCSPYRATVPRRSDGLLSSE